MEIKGCEFEDNVVTEIGKFTILWADFENNYDICNDCNSNKIWRLADCYSVDIEILKEFSNCLQKRANGDLQQYLESLFPQNSNSVSLADKKTIFDFINFRGENLFVGAMLTIYRIRNNLLHGLKREIVNLIGQVALFESMNKVLENIRRK